MSVTRRLGLFYAFIFLGTGVSAPYIGLWFKAHGLSGAQIGLILAAPAIARMVTGPAIAVWADGFRLRRTPLGLLGLGTTALYGLFFATHGFAAWWALWLVSQSLFANLSPLGDVIALRRARLHGFNYGWPRGMGSAAYVVANVLMGVMLTGTSPDAILWWLVATAAAAAVGGFLILPDDPVHEAGEDVAGPDRWRGLGGLLRDPVFMLAVVSVGLIQSSHAFYYGFSTLAWRAQGLPSSATGVLWGVGVVAEIGFLWFMEPLRRALGAERLVIAGAVGGLVRWTVLAYSPPLWVLVPIQCLHAATFTATFMGSLQLVERLSPPGSASAAQTVNSVLSGGLFMGLASMGSGALFDMIGARGYLAMSLLAGLGLAGAVALPRAIRRRLGAPATG
ncbi:MFS transporter [Caulobacter sp. KR2-114]|uniref:MFS transporter n=1 Tax=Caulobacter sp. KR2-114 TaxID=3400912 RepID=UPI003BFD6EB0